MTARYFFRAATSLVAAGLVVVVATPAVAATRAASAAPGWRGSGLTGMEVLGYFVLAPLGLFVVISLLFVLLPSWTSESRYRPGLVWTASPVWFGGPDNEHQSVEVAEPSQSGGGASASW